MRDRRHGLFNPVTAVLAAVVFALAQRGLLAKPPDGQETNVSARFDTRYESLPPRLQNLVADWIDRYNRTYGEPLGAADAYNELPLSTKTTFEAVSHALMKTSLTRENSQPLTADDGRPLRDALDLIDKLDAIKGKLKGAGGDQQFRIYVQLKSDAVRLLDESREFSRGADNLVYHRGYPMSFRSSRGVPSIQFSLSAAGEFADVDVDYRSSRFPFALFNGHLTSANSDVRAGDNHRRHNTGWAGLDEWWKGWDGLGEWWSSLHGVRGPVTVPGAPRKGDGKVDLAVFDFLSSWLVEQNLDVAVSYFSDRAFECLRDDDVRHADGDFLPQRLLRENMAAANDVLGRPAVLENVVQGVVPLDLRLTTLPDNEHDALFVLSEVPANRAVEFHCALRGVSVPRAYLEALRQVGDFRLSTFFLRSGAMRGATMSLLWSREAGLWRIISYELEAAVGLVPDLRSQVLEPRSRGAETLQGDPDFVGTNTEFLNAWIVEKDYTKALGFVSTKGYPCVGLFDDNDPASGGSNESVLPLRNGLQGVAEFVGAVDKHRLGDAIEGVLPRAEELRILAQSTDAYTLLSIPDDVAQSLSCMTPLAERQPIVSRGAPQYDNYYATSFRLRLVGEEPDAAFLVWAKENGEWRIVAFDLVTN